MRISQMVRRLAPSMLVLGVMTCSGDRIPPAGAGQGSSSSTTGATLASTANTEPGTPGESTQGPGSDSGSSSGSTTGEPPEQGPWDPAAVYPTPEGLNERGFFDRRGVIHSHSPYSHDACDGMPMDDDGNIDQVCFEDLRRGICQTQHDFIMLTDHGEFFASTDFTDALLHDSRRGDMLLERDGDPVANWAACDSDVRPTLLLAGNESATMPVGLEHHAPGGGATYGELSAAAIEELRAAGAVTLVAHAEDWEVAQLIDLPLDGFEMYNLHANITGNVGALFELLALVTMDDPGLPHSDLVIFPLWWEDPIYLDRWGSVLDSGVRRVTTMGTDSHRNSFTQLLPDGERIDSFRRMLKWFSNHLLVAPNPDGSWDDRGIKNAMLAGRLYGVFEYLGYAEGFDARIELGGGIFELGAEVSLLESPEIVVQRPHVQNLDPEVFPPIVTMHVMRAIQGGFEEVASETEADELRYFPDAVGAYRVEVRITPVHLSQYLGVYADDADEPRVWIYANPFYVRF